jgi:hypothetical protein
MHNFIAKDLRSNKYSKRVIKSKKVYSRKNKNKEY